MDITQLILLHKAVEGASAQAFLNVSVLTRLQELLREAGALTDTVNTLIEHTKTENRAVFNELNALDF